MAKKEWRRVVPLLEELGLLAEVDQALLAGYCQYRAEWQQYQRLLQQYGAVVKLQTRGGEGAYPVQSPYVGLANNAFDRMMKCALQFGFTPSAREGLRITPATTPRRPPTATSAEDIRSVLRVLEGGP